MSNVLITGAAGGVGVHVVNHFLTYTDWNITILDSFRHKGYRDRLRQFEDEPRVRIFQHDLACPIAPQMRSRIGSVDHIIHLAALSDVQFSVDNPVHTIKNNIDSTLTMLEYARTVQPETFVYFSTDEVYGPVKRGEAHPEWDTHRPSNAYAASKAASEDIAYAYWRSYDLPLILTNTMNNFGEMQSSSKFPVMVQKAVESGEKVVIHGNEHEIGSRFYIHSAVVADALRFILDHGARKHRVGQMDQPLRYHIVGDQNLTNLQLAQKIADLMGKPLRYRLEDFHKDNPAHDIHYGLQNNTLELLGWEPSFDLDATLQRTIEWQQEHPAWLS